MSAPAKRSLVCRAQIGIAVCRLWLNVCSCVEHKLVLPCVGSSQTFARVSSTNWFCLVSALAKCSLVCRAQIGFAVCQLWLHVRSCVDLAHFGMPCIGSSSLVCLAHLGRPCIGSGLMFRSCVERILPCRASALPINVCLCVKHTLACRVGSSLSV